MSVFMGLLKMEKMKYGNPPSAALGPLISPKREAAREPHFADNEIMRN